MCLIISSIFSEVFPPPCANLGEPPPFPLDEIDASFTINPAFTENKIPVEN